MMKSAPKPVIVPPTEVEKRPPPAVVSKLPSACRFAASRVLGNIRWYQADSMMVRQSLASLSASS